MSTARVDGVTGKPCPRCRSVGTLSIEPVLVARPIGSYSIAGAQDKVVARTLYRVTCSACDLRVTGRLEGATLAEDGRTFTGGHFVEVRDGEDTQATQTEDQEAGA